MMARRARRVVLSALGIGAVVAASRLVRGHAVGRHAPGGILVQDAAGYDRHARLLFASLYSRIAADIAGHTPRGARVLEVGCGPGHLSVLLASRHGLAVTGLDLDPRMIERARTNAARAPDGVRQAVFVVGDAATLPFADASFDLVVSTFSMHHWSDPKAGLNEMARVLRPEGKALIWDLKPGLRLFHTHAPDPAEQVHGSALRVANVRPWRWPWQFTLSQRLELERRW